MFSKPFIAGWGDMDSNAHMRNTAFLDRAADVRMMFFAESGFEMKAFAERSCRYGFDYNVDYRMAYNHYFGRQAAPAKKT